MSTITTKDGTQFTTMCSGIIAAALRSDCVRASHDLRGLLCGLTC